MVDPQQLNQYAYVRNNPLRLVDPTGEILQLSGDLAADKADLCQIAGDACNRITINDNGTVTFNTQGLDLGTNEGASLINNLVSSTYTYGFAESDTASTAGEPQKMGDQATSNLDNATDPRTIGAKRPQDLPPKGIDDQVTVNPNAPVQDTQHRPVSTASLAFHELAEAYAKVDGGMSYSGNGQFVGIEGGTRIVLGQFEQGPGAHAIAIQRELKLRDQRPYLKSTGFAGDKEIRPIIRDKK
jgi:hypothetical protein